VPAGTPEPVVARLARALRTALADPRFVERLAAMGAAPMPAERATPAALQAHLASELDRWGNLIRAAGIQPE
jgi:tripartite-type tricarboxylate transporter receptor subunit TctC